ncbi:MAG: flagellar hook-basal body complex protein [Candidatus Hatepunaea meridiana]|nr:flagellar hook-basal body complex protein [Candidatus Hatepunaea meridiana]
MTENMTHGLSALFSSLQAQKQKLELIGSNIANINTPGFKTGRITFAETFGMVVGNKQTPFSQGTAEFTGNTTDLAIVGNSFFVVQDGDDRYYTRAGAFHINADGKLVTHQGHTVQGWMNNMSSVSGLTMMRSDHSITPIRDIIIDSNLIVPAKATQNVWLTGNLNAGLENVNEVWTGSSAFSTKAILTGSDIQFPLDVNEGANDQFIIELNTGDVISEELTLSAGQYANVDSIVDEINARIAESDGLSGMVETFNANGVLKLRAIDGGNNTSLTVKSGTNDVLEGIGFQNNASATSGIVATGSTEINDLISGSMAIDDTIVINGKTADGTSITGTFTFGADNDGVTLDDLLTVINETYSGSASAELVDGKIVLTDIINGESETTISLTLGDNNQGEFNLSNFVNSRVGSIAQVSSSFIIYDSLGSAHNMTVEFEKTGNPNEWIWSVSGFGDCSVLSGGSGRILFDSDGNILSLQYDGGADSLTIDPGNDASTVSVQLHGENGEGFSGLSQFDSVSTLFARDQDGMKIGTFNGLNILDDGAIMGSFSNGEQLRIGQVAVARFGNPGALESVGGNNLKDTIDSGEAIIGRVDSQGSRIQSGSLEISTVDLADQFIQMIEAQRAFQAGARILTIYDEILQQTTQLGR